MSNPASSFLNSIFDSQSSNESRTINVPSSLFDAASSLELNQKLQAKNKRQRTNKEPTATDTMIGAPKTKQEAIRYRKECLQNPLTESLMVRRDSTFSNREPVEVFCEAIASTVKTYGVAVGEQVIDLETIKSLQKIAAREHAKVCQALQNRNLSWTDDRNNQETTIRFRQVVVRCKGRMDVLCDAATGTPELSFWENHPIVNGVVNTLLYGGETDELRPRLVYAGWIFSAPGSADQPLHQDGTPLFPSGAEHLPAYAINVFIPLEDTTIELGPTEFKLHSHHMPATTSVDSIDSACPLPRRGDMLVYDYRICHRGTANISTQQRSVLYLMYARPWFKEHVNFGSESLFAKETSQLNE